MDYIDEELLTENYNELRKIVDEGIPVALSSDDLQEGKRILIGIQQHFKGLKLRYFEREELYARLQQAFSTINGKLENARIVFELEADSNFSELKSRLDETLQLLHQPGQSRSLWDQLTSLRDQIRERKLTRDQRTELLTPIQETFELLKLERDEEKRGFEKEAAVNYLRVKEMVDQGLKQAEESHEFKETREFLKKIQNEFRGVKMVSEQREELYARLQTAFDILGKRLDEFFRTRKKNWETKMNFTLARYDVDIYTLQQEIEHDQETLSELEDQLDIIISSGKDTAGKHALQARILSTRNGINQKYKQLNLLVAQREDLRDRIGQDPE